MCLLLFQSVTTSFRMNILLVKAIICELKMNVSVIRRIAALFQFAKLQNFSQSHKSESFRGGYAILYHLACLSLINPSRNACRRSRNS